MTEPTDPEQNQVQVTPAEALQIAVELHKQGRLDEADGIYRHLLRARPDDVDALHFFGVLLAQRGDFAGAEPSIRKALQLRPGYVDARNNLGNVLRRLQRDAEAEVEYRAVLAANPEHADAWNNLGNVLRLRRDQPAAIAAYERALQLQPAHADACHNLANAYRGTGRVDDAIAMYRKALALRSDRAALYVSLGRTLHRLGRVEEAAGVYQQWLRQEPDHPIAAHMLAACSGRRPVDRASDAFVRQTFDAFAEDFDEVLAELDYRAPQFVAAAAQAAMAGRGAALDVLDAGCGTGLCGPLLRPLAARLVGVDLSPAMLTRARDRGAYDELVEAELTTWLRQQVGAFDLIASADVLVYFGDLGALVAASSSALRPGGCLVFTTERSPADRGDFLLHPHGRYSHAEAYLRRTLLAAGLDVARCEPVQLRLEGGEPVGGTLVVARREEASGRDSEE